MLRERNSLPIGTIFLVLVVALAALGVGYGLWTQSLFILGNVTTADVSGEFQGAFTDDDGNVDDPSLDSGDTGECQEGANTGCDPAAGGPDPKLRHDADVGRCTASVLPIGTTATVSKADVYPGYFCTAWLGLHNNGSLPIQITSVTVNAKPLVPGEPTALDLDADDLPDLTIHFADVQLCQQIDPSKIVILRLEQSILPDAPQRSQLAYTVEVQLIQWNQECAPTGDIDG